jgi:hypothetical protein
VRLPVPETHLVRRKARQLQPVRVRPPVLEQEGGAVEAEQRAPARGCKAALAAWAAALARQ